MPRAKTAILMKTANPFGRDGEVEAGRRQEAGVEYFMQAASRRTRRSESHTPPPTPPSSTSQHHARARPSAMITAR